MAASVPDSEMPVAVTVLAVPTFLFAKLAVPLTVNESPAIRSSEYVTLAAVSASYVLFDAVMVTASVFAVMFAVFVADVFGV